MCREILAVLKSIETHGPRSRWSGEEEWSGDGAERLVDIVSKAPWGQQGAVFIGYWSDWPSSMTTATRPVYVNRRLRAMVTVYLREGGGGRIHKFFSAKEAEERFQNDRAAARAGHADYVRVLQETALALLEHGVKTLRVGEWEFHSHPLPGLELVPGQCGGYYRHEKGGVLSAPGLEKALERALRRGGGRINTATVEEVEWERRIYGAKL